MNHMNCTIMIARLLININFLWLDSPGVPASANAHQLFKGFSFVAPSLLEDQVDAKASNKENSHPALYKV